MRKNYTTTEENQMIQMRKEGASYQEISEMFGRSKFAVQKRLSKMGVCGEQPERLRKESKGKPTSQNVPAGPTKKVTLNDFSPREIIKHLYGLGYRIENNQIVFYQRQVVNIKSVLEEG